MKKNILFILIDALREDHISTNKAIIPTIQKIKNNGFNFLSTTSSTSTTTPSFASLFTGLYPFENGVRSYSGYSLSKDIKTFPEILKENGYHTYAELTGPVLPELGLNKGFDEYNCRDRKNTIYTKWGEETLSKFKNHYKGPWFVFFHIFTLCFPRVVIKECQNKKFGKTQYARALSSVDTFLKKLIDTVDEDTLIIITSDHGEQIGKNHPEEFIKVKNLKKF
ncbi:MAG: sulfatase-like hydrolase/transferase [Mariniphaga sp.]|nr:sulfatase-like hydrolase/transferase [Mariniphaga sp.]